MHLISVTMSSELNYTVSHSSWIHEELDIMKKYLNFERFSGVLFSFGLSCSHILLHTRICMYLMDLVSYPAKRTLLFLYVTPGFNSSMMSKRTSAIGIM